MTLTPPPPTTPVRKIGIQTRSMTGLVPGIGRYESSLERDFMELVRCDPAVDLYTPQPCTIHYVDRTGKLRRYTPDALLTYHLLPGQPTPVPWLVEIKYRADFQGRWQELLPRFRAAHHYAKARGWGFKVLTEHLIRTPYLSNVRFLEPYRRRDIDPFLAHKILVHLHDLQEADAETLIMAMFRDRYNQAAALPVVWHLLATRQILADLSEPLTMHTRLWPLD